MPNIYVKGGWHCQIYHNQNWHLKKPKKYIANFMVAKSRNEFYSTTTEIWNN